MAYDNSFTAVTGDTFTAAQYNTYDRDNRAAVWVGTTAGDVDYYTSATAKSRLAIGALGKVLTSTGTAPSWKSIIHAKGRVHVAPNQSSIGTGWNDVTGAAFNLTLTATCTVIVLASFQGTTDNPNFDVLGRGIVNGVAGGEIGTNSNLFAGFTAIDYWTGVTAGTRAVGAQFQDWSGSGAAVLRCSLLAFAIAE